MSIPLVNFKNIEFDPKELYKYLGSTSKFLKFINGILIYNQINLNIVKCCKIY